MPFDREITADGGDGFPFGDQHGTSQVGFGIRPDVAELISREIPFLRRTVRQWHCDRADAEDLLQDTIVRVLANAHAWEPGTNFQAWAFTIMRNQFRANWARARRTAEAVTQMGLEDDPATDDGSLARLTLRDVQAALERLPPIQRETVLFVGVQGNSYQAVAHEMGISVASVRCHLARARARLRAVVIDAEASSPCAKRAARSGASRVLPAG